MPMPGPELGLATQVGSRPLQASHETRNVAGEVASRSNPYQASDAGLWPRGGAPRVSHLDQRGPAGKCLRNLHGLSADHSA